jgi:hypothetical protein
MADTVINQLELLYLFPLIPRHFDGAYGLFSPSRIQKCDDRPTLQGNAWSIRAMCNGSTKSTT